MSILWVDFETRSRCDLKTKGLYNYVLDPTTEVLCMSYAFDDGDVKTWTPHYFKGCMRMNAMQEIPPLEVLNHLGQIRAHNAAFERQVFEYVMGIGFSLEQYYCTATQARANCAPGSLEDAGRFAGASMRKSHRGMQLIRALSIPRPDGTFNDDPALMAEMIAYCEQDVRAMRDISTSMRQLSDEELHDYHVNERINDRGFLVDVPLCKAAVKYSDAELLDVQGLVKEIAEGMITSVRSSKMKQWVMERVGDEALALMTTHKDGVKKFSIDKTVRANLLILADENPEEVPNEVADVIQCADDIWASSVAKFNRLALLADEEDHKVRGALVFAGASATGRACVAWNTKVVTETGETSITLLKTGEKVLTHLGRFRKVSCVLYKGREVMYRVKLTSGAWVDCTENHRLLTNKGWKNVKEFISITRPENTGGSNEDIYFSALSYYGGDGEISQANSIYGKHNIERHRAERTLDDIKKRPLFVSENSGAESNGWCAETSRGDLSSRVSLPMGRGTKGVRGGAQAYIDEGDGPISLAGELGSTSYRQRQSEQFLGQLGDCVEGWASAITLSEITEIICLGKKGVWDISVEGDASYCAQGMIHHNSSYGAQVHNFTRKCYSDPEAMRDAMVRSQGIQKISGLRVTDVLKGMLRPSIIPAPGKQFIVSDWASIEARVNPWLSNSVTGDDVLDIFRAGKDIYITAAAKIFRCAEDEVTKAQRLVGKIAVLALGYQGAAGAFSSMCRAYRVSLSEQEIVKTVKAWRKANPWAVNQWRDLEEAATWAMRNKGDEIVTGRITYMFDGAHLWYVLPSGRILCYPHAKIDATGISYAKSAWKPAADAKEWPRAHLYGGLLTENCVQAIANDMLRSSLRECDKEELDVILHIHDEIVVESDNSVRDIERLKYIMTRPPQWCKNLPLEVDIKTINRYGK